MGPTRLIEEVFYFMNSCPNPLDCAHKTVELNLAQARLGCKAPHRCGLVRDGVAGLRRSLEPPNGYRDSVRPSVRLELDHDRMCSVAAKSAAIPLGRSGSSMGIGSVGSGQRIRGSHWGGGSV